jgi:hypothetical protein
MALVQECRHLRCFEKQVYVLLVGDTTISVKWFDVELVMESYSFQLPWNVPTTLKVYHSNGNF